MQFPSLVATPFNTHPSIRLQLRLQREGLNVSLISVFLYFTCLILAAKCGDLLFSSATRSRNTSLVRSEPPSCPCRETKVQNGLHSFSFLETTAQTQAAFRIEWWARERLRAASKQKVSVNQKYFKRRKSGLRFCALTFTGTWHIHLRCITVMYRVFNVFIMLASSPAICHENLDQPLVDNVLSINPFFFFFFPLKLPPSKTSLGVRSKRF